MYSAYLTSDELRLRAAKFVRIVKSAGKFQNKLKPSSIISPLSTDYRLKTDPVTESHRSRYLAFARCCSTYQSNLLLLLMQTYLIQQWYIYLSSQHFFSLVCKLSCSVKCLLQFKMPVASLFSSSSYQTFCMQLSLVQLLL